MRYYFDMYDGKDVAIDSTGVECVSLDAMREAAIEALPEIARDELPKGDRLDLWIKVRDEGGQPLFQASLNFSCKWLDEA